jgi:hypothetical protein
MSTAVKTLNPASSIPSSSPSYPPPLLLLLPHILSFVFFHSISRPEVQRRKMFRFNLCSLNRNSGHEVLFYVVLIIFEKRPSSNFRRRSATTLTKARQWAQFKARTLSPSKFHFPPCSYQHAEYRPIKIKGLNHYCLLYSTRELTNCLWSRNTYRI